MRTIRLLLEYDGTDFAGWQAQLKGTSIQEVVEGALAEVIGERVRLVSAGRTDAGVHARGMVAHFRTARDLPCTAFREGVNRLLPGSIAVRQASEMPADFHARFSAVGKWYRYTYYLAAIRSPLAARTAWHIRSSLDVAAMERGAAALVGRHDFAAFRASGCSARETVREIFSAAFQQQGELLHLDLKGEGFLRHMVRVIAGTLLEIGQGRRPWTDIERLLQQGKRKEAGLTAPPQGLCLMEIWYGPEDGGLRTED